MPDNSAAWSVAGNATSDLVNTLSVQNANRRNRKYANEVYDKTKADNLAFWNAQNAYNTPAAQMQRFKDAGLNPNLIYGSSGDNSAGNIQSPEAQSLDFKAPQIHAGSNILSSALAAADLKIKNAQANNLNIQSETLRQDAILRALQVEKEGVDIRRAGFDLAFLGDTRLANMDFLSESVRQKRIGTDLAVNADARAAIQTAATVSEAAERTLNLIASRPGIILQRGHTRADTERIRQNIQLMLKDGRLRDFEIKLSESNVTKSDPLWMRMILDFLTGGSTSKSKTPSFVPYKDVPLTPKRN